MGLSREQKLARRSSLGSSDIPAVAGLSPFAGPHTVYLQKVPEPCPLCGGEGGHAMRSGEGLDAGRTECGACEGTGLLDVVIDDPEDGTAATDVGTLAEPLLAALYERRSGRVLLPGAHTTHPRLPWASATPDRVAADGGPDVELKMVGRWRADDWSEDEVPPYYLAQVTWQMLVRGKRAIDVAALLGGTDFRVYHVELDDGLGRELLAMGEDFWHRHVLPRVAPPPDGTAAAREYLRRRFPKERLEVQPAPPEALGLVTELRMVKQQLKDAELHRKSLETRLQAIIGDAAGITDDRWGKVTWTSQAGGVSWKSIAEDLRTQLETVTQAYLQDRGLGEGAELEKERVRMARAFHELVEQHRSADVRVLRENAKPWTPPRGKAGAK